MQTLKKISHFLRMSNIFRFVNTRPDSRCIVEATKTIVQVDTEKSATEVIATRLQNESRPYSVVPLGPKPQILSCPHCNYYVTTEINIVPSIKTHLKAVVLCLCCICFLPYVCPICMNVDHFCPECENYIGTYIN